MTREKINDFKEIVLPSISKFLFDVNYEGQGKCDAEEFAKDFNEILDLAAKALENKPRFLVHSDGKIEQIIEPCDDAVSRQAVLKINENHHGKMPNHINFEIWNEIKALPPVLPKREQGEWIGVNPMVDTLMCSKCGENIISEEFKSNYCPNCGAEMKGVEE